MPARVVSNSVPIALQVKAGAKGGKRKAKAVAKKKQSQKEARQAKANQARGLATKTQGGAAG